ncbi:MAG TPA: CDP-alcohol phosphatidyltransferase family protein [Terriglobales bacterium]|nr:CDP-alcohol phosphatidyltransferase family protein [Terriglobales bacterium]
MTGDPKVVAIDEGYSDMGGAPLLPPEARRNALGFKSAPRVQGNFVAKFEKKTLLWLASKMPLWVNSDHLTAIGVLGQFLVGCSYLLARWNRWGLLLAIFFLAVNWFGDSLDGTLARHRDQQRPRYGFYVDHVLDSLGSLFLCVGLALSGYMHPLIAMGMLAAFLMLSVETYLATYTLGKFQMSHWIFGPTEIRITLAIGNVALFVRGPWAHLGNHVYRLFDIGGICAIGGMGLMFAIAAARHTITLYRQESL